MKQSITTALLLMAVSCFMPTIGLTQNKTVYAAKPCFNGNSSIKDCIYFIDRTMAGGGEVDDAPYLNKILRTYRNISLPCGIYLIKSSLQIPDDGSIQGSHCAIIKMAPDIAMNAIINSIFPGNHTAHTAISNATPDIGNHDIRVSGITIDGKLAPTNTHLAYFYKVKRLKFVNVVCIGSGSKNAQDCVASVNSSYYEVKENDCFNMKNACFDQWEGSHHFTIAKNTCDGNYFTSWCVLVNGLTNTGVSATSHDFHIVENTIRNINGVGIDVRGLCYNGACGSIHDGSIRGNLIVGTGWHCIWVGDAVSITLQDNNLQDCGQIGIYVASQVESGATSEIEVKNNTIQNAGMISKAKWAAIQIGNGRDLISNIVLKGNQVVGNNHSLALWIRSTSKNVTVLESRFDPGATGTIRLDSPSQTHTQ